MPLDVTPRVTAMLGPTNTGKTHYAIERMLAHRTGVIGLPLRLLAREVYDRIVALRGPSVVALVTGEERIVPARTAFWVCTVEAMPLGLLPEFLAVDEIQLAGDPDRGHIFTDRLLHARGISETLFLGSDTMRARIASLVPNAQFLKRERFSSLRYAGPRKISRMPPRSAVVGFSVEDVYAVAELIRRQKGGAAVVMGALSPRTRNAQVALYQNGDVDYLVATDAIGMGLNLDIAHVAFSSVVKFDGRRHRALAPAELGQIAGRAGRFTTDGSFGVTGEAGPLDPEVIEAIETHRFEPLLRLSWRNARLEFGGPDALIASLEAPSGRADLARAREADDLATLRALIEIPEIRARLGDARDMRLLWDVCQIPDFRKVSPAEHASLCARLYGWLQAGGGVPTDWLARQIARIDRSDGDIDALSRRLAYIRTWTYVAQRKTWVDDADHWREETRAVEDRLSDALHAQLTQRFVDRRTSVLMRRLKQREGLVATVTESGDVSIDDQFIGRLEGFRFRLDPSADAEQAKTLRAAGIAALAPALNLRADKFYNAPDPEIDVTEQGGLMWGEFAVGKLVAGADPLSPQIAPFVDEDAPPEVAEKVRRRLGHWIDRRIAALFQPLTAMRDDEALTGMARGVAFRLVESLGVLPRGEIADDVKGLDQDGRASLRKHGVRFGQFTVFLPLMLKPAPTRLRLVLWALKDGLDEFPSAPPPGLVTVPAVPGAPAGYYPRAGYRLAGDRAIRIDMLERLADIIRGLDAQAGFEASPDMLSITGLGQEPFAKLMQGLGYVATAGTRPKRKAPAAAARAAAAPDPATVQTPAVEGEALESVLPQGEPDATSIEASSDAAAPETAPHAAMEREAVEQTEQAPVAAVPEGAAGGDAGAAEALPDLKASDADPEPLSAAPAAGAEPDQAVPAEPATVDEPASVETAPETEARSSDLPAAPETEVERAAAAADAVPVEMEVFFTFVRAPRRRPDRGPRDARKPRDGQPHGLGRSEGEPRRDAETPGAAAPGADAGTERRDGERREGKRDRPRGGKPRHEDGGPKGKPPPPKPVPQPARASKPPEKPIDPDNPFAALMALKTRV